MTRDDETLGLDGALEGVRVVDLSRLLPGPLATRWLAELGATVVKIEDPSGGDMTRWVPPLLSDPPHSGLFDVLNANKRSVALDLREEAGRAALRALIASADVLFDSFRPGVMERFGFGSDAVRSEFPSLVVASLSGFGIGPDRARAGHDIGYMARAGALHGSGESVPVVQSADVGGSLSAVAAIALALYKRERTGRGSILDLSLSDAALTFGAMAWGKLRAGGTVTAGDELLDGSRPCYSLYRASDGHLAVGALEPKFWSAFCAAIGREDLTNSGHDGGEAGRAARTEVQGVLLERTRAEWTRLFREVEACVEPVLTPSETLSDPHHLERGVVDGSGAVRSPWTRRSALGPAPRLGEHTASELRATNLDGAFLADVLSALGRGTDA